MRIAVTIGVYNEEKNIDNLIKSLLSQNHIPDKIIIVDDGSKDKTAEIIKKYTRKSPIIKYIHQENAGPAAARNTAWKNSKSDICIFTDGDCIPEKNWIEELIKPFSDNRVGASAGRYKTLNNKNILAKFIGLEIAWRYRNTKGEIDAHGTYNLAVRRNILEEIGGLDESYPVPSGEDWDMTYKISKKYKIIYTPSAVVGTYHPEKFWWYMKNQVRRAYDRVKVYKDHPERKKSDNYTPKITKYQILASGLFIPSIILIYPFFKFSYIISTIIFLFLFLVALWPFLYFAKRDLMIAFCSIPIQICRNFIWFIGLLKGMLKLDLN